MNNIWSRYSYTSPLAREIIRKHEYGAIITQCWIAKVYPTLEPGKPNWEPLDSLLGELPGDYPVHFHPLVCRCPKEYWKQQEPILEQLIYPIIDRYQHRVKRWTLANELLLAKPETLTRTKQLYLDIGQKYPNIQLWCGDYGLRKRTRRREYLQHITDLKEALPNFKGTVWVDYIDLADNSDGKYWRGLKGFAKSLAAIAVDPLGKGFAAVNELELQTALETNIFTGPNPSATTLAQQAEVYKAIQQRLQDTSTELWVWDILDGDCSARWLGDRYPQDCPGWFDASGVAKW